MLVCGRAAPYRPYATKHDMIISWPSRPRHTPGKEPTATCSHTLNELDEHLLSLLLYNDQGDVASGMCERCYSVYNCVALIHACDGSLLTLR